MDADAARHRLGQERAETIERLRALRADIAAIIEASDGSNADDEHDPEGATIAFERSRTDALAQQAVRHLEDVDAALARIEDGSYGRCAVCGEAIPDERLEARPTATTDLAHAPR